MTVGHPSEPAVHAKPLRSTWCGHSDGVLIGRETDGRSRAQCLSCGMVGLPRGDFRGALRTLEERAKEE